MRLAAVRRFCLSLPAATETVQWGGTYVYKVGGRMFATIGMDGRKFDGLAFKVSDDSFHILTRESGIVPAPYLARAGWVRLNRLDVLPTPELKAYLTRAHALIAAKLSKRLRKDLSLGA
jgi:predicted DNA-binding protein (MmcQ/YjbR family)